MKVKVIELRRARDNRLWRAIIDGPKATVEYGKVDGKLTQIERFCETGHQGRSESDQQLLEIKRLALNKISKNGYEIYNSNVPGIDGEDVKIIDNKDLEKEKESGKEKKDLNKTKEEIINSVLDVPLPMLAKEHKAMKTPTDGYKSPYYIQHKLDGLRCLAHLETGRLFSRSRKEFPSHVMPHISNAVRDIHSKMDPKLKNHLKWLDGEIYNHEYGFQLITSLARTHKNVKKEAANLELHVFDAMLDTKYSERKDVIDKLLAPLAEINKSPVKLVKTIETTFDSIDQINKDAVELGYEGIMIRLDLDIGYQSGKRSSSLIKSKPFFQEEFKCIGMIARDKEKNINQDDMLGSVTLVNQDGQEFQATPSMSDDEKKEMWINREQYKDWVATVKFQNYTEAGIPRFPVIVGFRHPDDT